MLHMVAVGRCIRRFGLWYLLTSGRSQRGGTSRSAGRAVSTERETGEAGADVVADAAQVVPPLWCWRMLGVNLNLNLNREERPGEARIRSDPDLPSRG